MLDAEDLPAARFHFINTEQVFEHLLDPLGTVGRLAEALRGDGLLKISVPNAADLDRRLGRGTLGRGEDSRLAQRRASSEHLNAFTARAIEAMATTAGLRRVKIPLREQYAAATNWRPPKEFVRNLGKPLVRNFSSRTYLFFSLDRA